MGKREALNAARQAIATAGGVHGRNSGNQDLQDLANAVLQLARAVEALAEVVE